MMTLYMLGFIAGDIRTGFASPQAYICIQDQMFAHCNSVGKIVGRVYLR